MATTYVPLPLEEVIVGEPLPAPVALQIDFKFITYRTEGDILDRGMYDRLIAKGVKSLFVAATDRESFKKWAERIQGDVPAPDTPEEKLLVQAKEDMKRATALLFSEPITDASAAAAITSAKQMALAVMNTPNAMPLLATLQGSPRGTFDHSINISVLSGYLGVRMGYTNQRVLEILTLGGLFHDIGKAIQKVGDNDSADEIDRKRLEHPAVGAAFVATRPDIPPEVRLIIEQHHEYYDGSGFPKGLRGASIFELASVVGIANLFDELVAGARGSLLERQVQAMRELQGVLGKRVEPKKLQIALDIFRKGI
jgi:putative nucleotidyltransferase with HDIG domain